MLRLFYIDWLRSKSRSILDMASESNRLIHYTVLTRTIHLHSLVCFRWTRGGGATTGLAYLSINPSTHLTIFLPTHLSSHLPTYLSIHPSIHLPIHPSVQLSIHSFIYPLNNPQVELEIDELLRSTFVQRQRQQQQPPPTYLSSHPSVSWRISIGE